MASYFQMTSAEELAEKIVTARSENRQQMLSDFYASQWPELKDLFTIQVPVELPGDFEKAEDRSNSRRKKSAAKDGNSVSRVPDEQSSSGTAESCSQKQHKRRAVKLNYDSVTNKEVSLPTGERELPSGIILDNASQEISHTSEEVMSSPGSISKSVMMDDISVSMVSENIVDTKSTRRGSLCKLEGRKAAIEAAEKDSIADLIGDTSILNDLFRSYGSNQAMSTRLSHPELPAVKAKTKPKDFWDLLNEQNDESLSKLTDVSVIQEVCERASFSVAKKKEEWDTSLWKKNENFLWKKYDPRDDRDQGSPGT